MLLSNFKTTIAVIAANPDLSPVDLLEEEAAMIRESYKLSGGEAEVIVGESSQESHFTELLSAHRPTILHFTGHGAAEPPNIYLENRNGKLLRKGPASLARLLKGAQLVPNCVVMNNCMAAKTPGKLLNACQNVVSVKAKGAFDICIGFSKIFYGNIGLQADYHTAYRLTRQNLAEEGLLRILDFDLFEGTVNTLPEESLPTSAPDASVRVDQSPSREPAPKQIADESEKPRKFTVWFGTTRRPLDPARLEAGFSGERDDKLRYGKCDVAIPRFHKIGSTGSPWWVRWPRVKDDRLKVLSRWVMEEKDFWFNLRATLAAVPELDRTVLLFIHGYNVSFDQAAIRAAQLGADLGIRGATAFFSWPSKGAVRHYAADAAAVEASEDHLVRFLEQLATTSSASRVHVIAHSMGNRALLRAFDKLMSSASEKLKLPFSQIFLAAPDIDAAVFKTLATCYPKLTERTTMYISSKDKALWGSKFLHGFPRAGYTPPVTIVGGIDTVEVSNIDVSLLGHGYIGAARDVLHDIHSLLQINQGPSERMGVEEVNDPATGLCYWRIRA